MRINTRDVKVGMKVFVAQPENNNDGYVGEDETGMWRLTRCIAGSTVTSIQEHTDGWGTWYVSIDFENGDWVNADVSAHIYTTKQEAIKVLQEQIQNEIQTLREEWDLWDKRLKEEK